MDFQTSILADMECFLYKGEMKEWLRQVDRPFFFMKFNPSNKTIVFCRFGTSNKPFKVDPRLWFRIDAKDTTNQLRAGIRFFNRLWDDFTFDQLRSELVPSVLPNTKFVNQALVTPLRQMSMYG